MFRLAFCHKSVSDYELRKRYHDRQFIPKNNHLFYNNLSFVYFTKIAISYLV